MVATGQIGGAVAREAAYFCRVVANLPSLNPFRVLVTHRNFRRFWVGQTLSLIGTWMQSMGQGWLALQLSDSAFVVGLVAAAGSLPILLFSLYAGVVVDRSDKLRLVKIAQSLLLLEAGVLWWFTWSGHITIPILIALALFSGMVGSLEIPARQSLMIDLVGRDDLRDAIALNSSGFNLARILGPSLGALIIANFGLAWCFGVNALSYLTVLVSLASIALPKMVPPVIQSPWAGMRDGLLYVLHDRPVRGLVEMVATFSVLGIPYLALMPVYARDQLGLGAGGYGLMLAAVGIGGLAGALGLAAVGRRVRRGRLLTVSALGYAASLVAVGAVRSPRAAVPLLLVTGCLMIVTNALGNGLLQSLVPDEYRGRLMSIYSLIAVGLPQVVGAFGAGAIAKVVGVDWSIAGTAAAMLVYGIVAFRRYPEIRRI